MTCLDLSAVDVARSGANRRRTGLAIALLVAALIVPAHADQPATAPSAPETATLERLGDEAAQMLAKIYDYDRTIPLDSRLVERIEKNGTIREKIVFRGAQGFLVPAYFEFAAEAKAPYPCVLLLHGWSGSKENWWTDGNYISGGPVRKGLLAAGYAILALDAQCHGDRIAQNDFAPVNHFTDPALGQTQRKGYFTMPDIYIQTTRDYRRAIDYLETRSDVNSARIGMVGYSMGGTQTFLLNGVEPRVKASVSCVAPAEKSKFSPIAPQNFVGGIGERPFLMIMGLSDPLCPADQARGLFALIKGPHAEAIYINAGHKLPVDYVPHAVGWIQKHL